MHIYRWDLDRTYLDTDIHSVRSMIKAAFETAVDKRNIPGSAALMRGLMRSDPDSRVGIVSGSPTQLRAVLEAKLALDGVKYESLVLKDHLSNLRRGRLRAVYGQLGYKLPALLQQRAGQPATTHETCFGDDTEVDAVVYALYAELLAGRVGVPEMARVMAAGDAYPESIELARSAIDGLDPADVVDDVFIHVDRGVAVKHFRLLGERVIPVFSWFQAALVLCHRERLDAVGVAEVLDASRGDAQHAAAWVQDVARRGLVPRDALMDILDRDVALGPVRQTAQRALDRLGTVVVPRSRFRPDFLAYLSAIRH